jgi:hypothetical protein
VSITPEPGAAGLPSDVTIEITFSEPMNKVATQAAFQSANLGSVTFDWPSDDVMVVRPNAPLEYAAGSSLSVAPKKYGFSITNVATDLTGHSLATSAGAEFSTLRQITLNVPLSSKHWSYSEGAGGVVTEPGVTPAELGINIGDLWSAGHPTNSVRALFVFDMADLPNGIVSFVSATLSMSVCCPQGNPGGLGAVMVDHISVSPIDTSYFYSTPLDASVELATNLAPGIKTASVKVLVEGDYSKRVERGNKIQLRIGFASEINANMVSDLLLLDDRTQLAAGPKIAATFLVQ